MDETLMVCPDAKDGVTQCQREGCTNPAKKKFCSSACRQAAHRKNSEAHKAALADNKDWCRRRRNAYFKLQRRDKALTPYFTASGPSSSQAFGRGSLGMFWTRVVDEKRVRLNLDPEVSLAKP